MIGSAGLGSGVWGAQVRDPVLDKLPSNRSCCLVQKRTALSQQLASIIHQSSWKNSWDDTKVKLLNCFSSNEFPKLSRELRKVLRELDSKSANELMDAVALKSIRENLPELIIRAQDLFSSTEFQKIKHNPEFIKKKIEFMARCADVQNEHVYTEPTPSAIRRFFRSIIHFIHSLLDTVLMAFSFFEVGKEPASSWEASHMIQVYGQLFSIPLVLMTFLTAVIGAPLTAGLVTGGVIAAVILLLVVYIKYLKPPPEHIRGTVNFSARNRKGEVEPITGCYEYVVKLAKAIAAGEKPIIVAKSRRGKSTILLALAQYLRSSDPTVPKSLKNKDVIYVNAADWVGLAGGGGGEGGGGGGAGIPQFRARAEKEWHKYIVVIDEGHVPVMPQYFAKNGTQFNILLDDQPQSIPFAVVATTDVGYQYILNSDLKGRLKKIDVLDMPNDVTLQVLEAMALRIAPELEISKEVLNKIIQLTNEVPDGIQPNISKKMLRELISVIRETQNYTDLEKVIRDLKIKEKVLCDRGFLAGAADLDETVMDEELKLQKEIKAREAERKLELIELDKLQKLKLRKVEKNRYLYQLAQKIKQNGQTDALMKEFTFTLNYVLPALDHVIKQRHGEMRLPQLTTEFATEYITKELKERAASESAMKAQALRAARPADAKVLAADFMDIYAGS